MGGGNVSFGRLDRGKDSSGVNEKRFAFLRKHQPPGCPVQKLGPEAALQSRKDAGHAGGGQTGLAPTAAKVPKSMVRTKTARSDNGCIFMTFW